LAVSVPLILQLDGQSISVAALEDGASGEQTAWCAERPNAVTSIKGRLKLDGLF
jgi:hypothetical protein